MGKFLASLFIGLLAAGPVVGIAGCENNESAFEEAGENIDEGIDEVRQEVD